MMHHCQQHTIQSTMPSNFLNWFRENNDKIKKATDEYLSEAHIDGEDTFADSHDDGP